MTTRNDSDSGYAITASTAYPLAAFQRTADHVQAPSLGCKPETELRVPCPAGTGAQLGQVMRVASGLAGGSFSLGGKWH